MKLLREHLGLIIVIALGLLPLFIFLLPGLPQTHDGRDHVARIANFYQGLSDGVLIPRWGANLNWSYGHPVLMFLYPFSSYFASLFHFLGFSLVASVKLVFAITFVLSGIGMYLWAKEAFGRNVGIVAAVIYMYAPYRFVDMYVRGAIGEHCAFVFLPFVLYFLLRYMKEKRVYFSWNAVGVAISMGLLLLAHNAISIMFLPFIIFYLAYLLYEYRKFKKVSVALAFLGVGFLLSSFFLLPAFFEGKYTLRDIVTGNEYSTRFIEPVRFIWSEWAYGNTGNFTNQVGIIPLLGVLLSPFVLFKLKKNKKGLFIFLLGTVAFFALSIFLQVKASEFVYEIVTTLKKFQFPWRFLSLTVLTTAVITSFALFLFNKKREGIVAAIIVFLAVISSTQFWQVKGFLHNPETFYSGVYYSTTDTGESSPIWSVRFMEKVPGIRAEIVEGEGSIVEKGRSTVYHSYEITTQGNARIKENTVYFPGWNVYVNGVMVSDIQFQDPQYRGLITFNLPEGNHFVELRFEETKMRMISNYVSLGVLVLLVVYSIVLVTPYAKKH